VYHNRSNLRLPPTVGFSVVYGSCREIGGLPYRSFYTYRRKKQSSKCNNDGYNLRVALDLIKHNITELRY